MKTKKKCLTTKQIRLLRIELGLSAKEMAELLQISEITQLELENGMQEVSTATQLLLFALREKLINKTELSKTSSKSN